MQLLFSIQVMRGSVAWVRAASGSRPPVPAGRHLALSRSQYSPRLASGLGSMLTLDAPARSWPVGSGRSKAVAPGATLAGRTWVVLVAAGVEPSVVRLGRSPMPAQPEPRNRAPAAKPTTAV